ncbi:hypothetical protein V1477_012816 [Vespula maculifrons]|uniref:Uncharacterized protein n=1 Tax=Vespula maculifrons TaxID=7453 RepID=A0ABD2BU65_VESMC
MTGGGASGSFEWASVLQTMRHSGRPRGRQGFSGESDSPTTKCHSMNEVSTSKDDGETSAFRLAISQKRCYRGSRGKHSM